MLKRLGKELLRQWLWLALVVIAIWCIDRTGSQVEAVLYRLSMLAVVVIAMHLGRKSLFPYLDLEARVKTAGEHPIGAGLIWLGAIIFMAVFMAMAMVK